MNANISTDITVKEMCVGCPTEAFHTLAEVSQEYHLSLDQLLERIYETLRNSDVPEDG
ncbi:MAG: hypothetical protein JRH03_08475 [Deltaproteobacteria bacterium]|nr:hypothetical protein [Deltaproteobacteria bacterium]